MNNEDTVDDVLRLVMLPADGAFLDAQRDGETGAVCVRRAVEEAFRCALDNGMITLVPTESWPSYVVVSSPYDRENTL